MLDGQDARTLGKRGFNFLRPGLARSRFSARQLRADAYRTWLEQGVSDDELIAIRRHLQQERAFGSKRFQAMAEKTLGRPVNVRRPGRPSRDDEGGGI